MIQNFIGNFLLRVTIWCMLYSQSRSVAKREIGTETAPQASGTARELVRGQTAKRAASEPARPTEKGALLAWN